MIKAQILTFREAFYLTEKGQAYFQKKLQERINTENAEPIILTEIDGKWCYPSARKKWTNGYGDSAANFKDYGSKFRYGSPHLHKPKVYEWQAEMDKRMMDGFIDDMVNNIWNNFKRDHNL